MDRQLELIKEAALDAGRAIMEVYDSGDALRVDNKADDSPLTMADRAAHERIVARLQGTGLPVLSEEGRDIPYEERRSWGAFWLVDPLDGTKEFIKRNGEFTVNIALVEAGRPVYGVVYVPAAGVMYWGGDSRGAWRRGSDGREERIQVNTDGLVHRIVASRSHINPETELFMKRYPDAEIISMGSSLKFMAVAEGRAQLYPRFGPTMEWDTAAAQAVVEGAGGSVRTQDGQPLVYNKESLLNPYFVVSSLH